mmetsp:Transcript_8902/g.14714  ORF Transcript_8902/g.14714 Transcript_8902/m.14714 type:complete len:106 (+) Transcript_8902:2432-2749(+)
MLQTPHYDPDLPVSASCPEASPSEMSDTNEVMAAIWPGMRMSPSSTCTSAHMRTHTNELHLVHGVSCILWNAARQHLCWWIPVLSFRDGVHDDDDEKARKSVRKT